MAENQSSNAGVEQALIEIESQLDDARVQGDIAFFDQTLAEDFRSINPIGKIVDKPQSMVDTRSGDVSFKSSKSDDLQVRVYGEMAVITGRATMVGHFKGHSISGQYRYTHVYLQRDGRWQVVSAQSNRVMPAWAYLFSVRLASIFGA